MTALGLPKLEEGAAIAVLSFAVLEVFRLYTSTAPRLNELRRSAPGDWDARQALLDADMMTGILVVVMGGAGLVLMRRWYPFVIVALTFVAVSTYYHGVQDSTNREVFA